MYCKYKKCKDPIPKEDLKKNNKKIIYSINQTKYKYIKNKKKKKTK